MKNDFLNHFNLSEKDMDSLWDLFKEFGMDKGEGENRSKGNHYFLQAICQYNSVEWETWKDNLTDSLKTIIKEEYPQLKVQNKKFEKQ